MLLYWYHASDYQENCMAYAENNEDKWCGEFECCWKYLYWTGTVHV